ncbi:MAG: hypothetical protein J0L73_08415 [Verrucomicrobia bacterium]|nr:hypothetical protein [Verrucomicrobiota bacterium]
MAQSPAVDRAVTDLTIREALRTTKRDARDQRTVSPATQEEINLLDREFGQQSISGLVRQKPQQFLMALEAGGFFTSNAALAPGPETSDWVGRTGLRGAWFPKLTDHVNLLAMANYSLWRYADQQQLDFDDFGSQIGLQYHQGRGELMGGLSRLNVWAQYRYQRLTSPWNWGNRLYENHFLETGLRKGWLLSPTVSVWLGGNAAVSVGGGPSAFRRHEFSTQAGAAWQITPKLAFTSLYRFAWFDYVQVSRNDLNHLLFLGLGYQVTSNLTAQVYVSGIFNHSDVNAFDYKALNTGMGLVLSHVW